MNRVFKNRLNEKSIRWILPLLFLLFVGVAAGLSSSVDVFAEGEGWGGGDSGSHSPVSGGSSSGGSGSCDNYYSGGKWHDGTRLGSDCMGYSWMFFKATGPTKVVNGNTVGEEIYFRPYLPYGGISDPYISDICAGSDKKGNRLGFWHLGRNAGGYYEKGIFNTTNHWETIKGVRVRGEELKGLDSLLSINGNVSSFKLFNTSTSCKNGYVCALGHMATWSYDYINGKYRYRWQKSDFGNPFYVQHMFDGNNIAGRPSGVSGSYVYGGQRLYKKINGVDVEIYRSYRVASESEVFELYKEAYRIQNGGEAEYTDSWFPGDLYAFCSWEFFPEYTLTAKSIDESGSSLASVSGLGNKDSGKVRERRTASVTRGTNSQYLFLGWKAVANGDYIKTTDSSQASYVSGSASPKETFNVKSITADATVYAVYRKVSLVAKAVDEKGNPLDGKNGRNKIDDVTATGFTAGGAASVTRRTDNRYIFKGFKLADSAADTVNREFITTINSGASHYVTGTPTEESARESFHVKSLANQLVVYAVYEEKSSFLGQIQLLEGATQKAAVGYSDKTLPTVTYNINNCSPTDGCKVTFVYNFQRKSGDKTVTYTITRDSNYYVSNQGRGVESKTLVPNLTNGGTESFIGVDNNTTKQVYKDEEMVSHPLYPGQVVCETLSFKPFVWKDDSVTLTLCASALGNAQPNDPADPGNPDDTGTPWDDPNGDNDNLNGASAFLKIEVKNENVSRYGTYRKIVYAKPGDTVKYRATYNPILQYTAYLKPQQMRIDGGSNIYPSSTTINTSQYLKDLFNSKKGSSLKNWNNAFYVSGVISNNYNNKCRNGECIYDVGVFTKQSEESNSVTVQPGNVGQELKEMAKTNQNNNTKTTSSQVEFTSNGEAKYNLGNVITNQKTSEAFVRVPYNFDISVCMKKAQNDTECAGSDLGVFDAGARKDFYFEVDVNKKANSETAGGSSYATAVPRATTKIILYKGGVDNGGLVSGDICVQKYGLNADGVNCKYSEVNEWEGNNALNVNGVLEGAKKTLPATFDVPDMEAGASYCVAAAVYPASSADVNAANYATNSTGWKDEEGNHMWRVSKSVCFTIGKKPTFQVWGGSFYGGGKITVSSAAKNSLTLQNPPRTELVNGVLVFSSWVEQTVVAGGNVEKLASGAATGLVFNNDKNKAEGGSLENPESFCKYRVPLSIANYDSGLCQENSGNLTGNSNIIVNTNKKIFTEIATEGVERISVDGDYSTPNYPMIVIKGTTRIIEATGKVIINGNIIYDENESYNNIEEIPKMVIYAKDIEINCSVTRIDAILLADGTIYSCGTYTGKGTVTDYNEARTRTNLLTVNGAIFTKQLELGRTYGMGTGTYSKIPAEIVNYDSSIILWARGKSDTDDFEKMYQVYINELAPRY